MRTCGNRSSWVIAAIGAAGLLLEGSLAGCNHREPATPKPNEVASTDADYPGRAAVTLDPHWHQSFAEATFPDPPAGWKLPPETTMTGKSVGKLYTEVVGLWDSIRFVSPHGKPLVYRAILDTEMGIIEIALRPDWAPNHVRSFVALARVGYYDGLIFERTLHDDENPEAKLDLIEAGSPIDTDETGYGSIGYWLKPEKNSQATHDEGTVGAMHGEQAEGDGCQFYITLAKTPSMDGDYTLFGKVTRGLDVARRILSLPLSEAPEGDRPARPVVIRKVTIETD